MSPEEQYAAGLKRGLREGRDASNVYEQDFAYQNEDYTKGYWDGFKTGINETKETSCFNRMEGVDSLPMNTETQKTIGPDGAVTGHWYHLDLTAYRGDRHGYLRAQGPAVQVVSYRNGKYAVVDANGFRFRADWSDLTV